MLRKTQAPLCTRDVNKRSSLGTIEKWGEKRAIKMAGFGKKSEIFWGAKARSKAKTQSGRLVGEGRLSGE
jgi:hypothetical protein